MARVVAANLKADSGVIVAGKRVTVLGGGNTAFSMAANLALAGFEVLLW
jgi:cation diffusion facilitator CzcD-associated flavoprotein CzcO